mgnify:CR=1 FL=1
MRLKDIFQSILIILVFIGIMFINVYFINFKYMTENWDEYRCNPLMLPFTGFFGYDPKQNFTECVRSYQTHFIGDMLGSVFSFMGSLMQSISDLVGQVEYIRNTVSKLAKNAGGIFDNIINMFVRVIIQFQRITIGLKDTFGKMIGITTNIMYIVSASITTGESLWNGPVGTAIGVMEDIGNTFCFHPDTRIQMNDGTFKKMRHVCIGEKLLNNNEVLATMQIKGNQTDPDNPYYKIYSEKDDNFIYVTGDHMVKYNDKILKVKQYPGASKVNIQELNSLYFCCFVTKTHEIVLGEHIFMDWEYV